MPWLWLQVLWPRVLSRVEWILSQSTGKKNHDPQSEELFVKNEKSRKEFIVETGVMIEGKHGVTGSMTGVIVDMTEKKHVVMTGVMSGVKGDMTDETVDMTEETHEVITEKTGAGMIVGMHGEIFDRTGGRISVMPG